MRKKLQYLNVDLGKKFANQVFEEYITKEDVVKKKPNMLYILKQNKKAKYLNYSLMSLIFSILIAIHLLKMV